MKQFPLSSRSKFVVTLAARVRKDWITEPEPTVNQFAALLNAAFWASMQSEEGKLVRSTLALTDPRMMVNGDTAVVLDHPIPLSPQSIAKLSASFPFRPGALGVDFTAGQAGIWGIALPKPEYGWLIEILGPGYLGIRNSPSVDAVLLPDGSNFVFPEGTRLEDEWYSTLEGQVAEVWDALLRNPHQIEWGDPATAFAQRSKSFWFLREIARAMRDHRRGGSIVFVNARSEDWRSWLDIKYEFERPQTYISSVIASYKKWAHRWWLDQERKKRPRSGTFPYLPESVHENRVLEALRLVGGLTAVDGALVMTADFKLLGYGAKLRSEPRKLTLIECLPEQTRQIDLQSVGGTRHQSAAQFVEQHPQTLILVASQDGRFTIFLSDEFERVLALRLELLLL